MVMAETCCNIRKYYRLPKSTHGYSCPSLCVEPKVIYGLFYSWLYIPLCAACVWAVRSFLEQNCLGPFCFVSALWIIMNILNHSIHISFGTKRQTMYFGGRIKHYFCLLWQTVDLSSNMDDHLFLFPGKCTTIQFNCIQYEFHQSNQWNFTPQYIIPWLKYRAFSFHRCYLVVIMGRQ